MNPLSFSVAIQTQSTAAQQPAITTNPANVAAGARTGAATPQISSQARVAATTAEATGFGGSRLVNQLFSLMGFGAQPTVIVTPPQQRGSPTDVVLGGDSPKDVRKPEPKTTSTSLVPARAQIFKATGSMDWQPKGSNGTAEMFFRPQHKGKIAKIELLSEDGTKVIARPVAAGVDSKGRPVFRFDKDGAEFPKGAIVMMTMTGGGIRYLEIPNPGKSFKH